MLLAESLLGSSSLEPVYIEDVFSTWLYTGNGTTQTITNEIDLAGNGGLVWLKSRSGTTNHALYDSVRGATFDLASNLNSAQTIQSGGLTSFSTDGFSIGSLAKINTNAAAYVSWTFRKQPKFFDIVTYTGNGANRTIAHTLQSEPGCIMVKRLNFTGDWQVYHRSLANTEYFVLNSTAAAATDATRWNNTTATATEFSLGTSTTVNATGGTYVAYLFAHDAGGFGDTGADNVISCGSFVHPGAGGATVTLGYEPQWVFIRSVSATDVAQITDNLRSMTTTTSGPATSSGIAAGSSLAESLSTGNDVAPLSTGFFSSAVAGTYVYIAIRRGPMRTPTSGTEVFKPVIYTGTNVDNRFVNTSIMPDMVFVRQRNDTVLGGMVVGDRLRGQPYLLTGTVAAEVSVADAFDQELVSSVEYGNAFSAMNGFWCGNDVTAKLNVNTTSNNHVVEAFRRAPGFFDIVAYRGTGANGTVGHNLVAAPELMIVKRRSAGDTAWQVYSSALANTEYLVLNTTAAKATGATRWNSTNPTSSVFSLGTASEVNTSNIYYVAYLFATLAGVSKVGSYTGTGATQTINCGFSAGARFILVKRTDSTGDWFVWDTARGIIAASDPYLRLNSTAAEITNTDWVDPAASGFALSNAAGNNANINGASYIFLAVS